MTYIGEKEIKSIEDNKVTFVDWTEELFTEKELSYIVSDKARNLSEMRDEMLKVVLIEMNKQVKEIGIDNQDELTKAILNIIDLYNIRKWDIDYILTEFNRQFNEITRIVIDSYNLLFLTAIWKAFKTYKDWQHHSYFTENIRVSDLKNFK